MDDGGAVFGLHLHAQQAFGLGLSRANTSGQALLATQRWKALLADELTRPGARGGPRPGGPLACGERRRLKETA